MKIIEIVSGHALNGAMRHAFALTCELARRGHSVTVICRPDSWIAKRAASERIDVEPSDLHRWPPDELRRVAALIRDRGADLVHTHMSRAHFFGVLLKTILRTPIVATAHTARIQPHWRFNDRTIAVSESVRRFHRRWNGVPANRIEAVHPFVDPDEFAPATPRERIAARRVFNLEPSTPLVGVVGSVFPEKGIHHVIRAMPLVLAALPHARLAIVGDGPEDYRHRLMADAERLGVARQVAWIGHRDPVVPAMAALDLLATGSSHEGFALHVVEGMAMGVPIVAPALGCFSEGIRDGETGYLVRPRDPSSFASACVTVLRDPELRGRLGAAARADVLGRFTPHTQVPRIESIFRSAVAARGASH
jgi:L-malate glycosyltransferase